MQAVIACTVFATASLWAFMQMLQPEAILRMLAALSFC
jgi:hypothetical protein